MTDPRPRGYNVAWIGTVRPSAFRPGDTCGRHSVKHRDLDCAVCQTVAALDVGQEPDEPEVGYEGER